MEICVSEYVRTKAGHLYKITRIDENGLIYWNKIQCGWSMEQLKDIVAKHSKNIIDLVEVGDIVHIKDVLHEDITYIWSEDYLKALKEDIQNGIKLVSIVTKEQMQSIEYKVEEDK